MSRRRRHGLGAALVVALSAASSAGCQADLGSAGCKITRQATLAGSPLTLLADARLDAIGSGYALIGYDLGANVVRWAALSADGVLGPEHAFGLPTEASKPVFAMAEAPGGTPGDTVLIGYLGTDSTKTKGELAMIAVPADGSPPAAAAAPIHEFPSGVPPVSSVTMISSRKGVHAGLAWIDDQMGRVMYAAVDGTGQMVVAPSPAAQVTPSLKCLAFVPGKDDVTITYPADLAGVGQTEWVIAEGNESGGIDSSVTLTFARQMGSCASFTPTSSGYALAWQDTEGGWLGVYKAADSTVPAPYPFAPANGFGGANLQPPIVALAPFADDFGVLFDRAHDVELWRLDGTGDRRSGALIFPSVQGNLGGVSAVRLAAPDNGLAATYADYTAADGGTAGARLFVNATCY